MWKQIKSADNKENYPSEMECEEFIQIIRDLAERIESACLGLFWGKNIQDFKRSERI